MQVPTEENGFLHLSKFGEGLVRRVLDIVSRESAKNRLCFRGSKAESGGVLHHLVVLPADELPVDGPGENGLEVRIVPGAPWPRVSSKFSEGSSLLTCAFTLLSYAEQSVQGHLDTHSESCEMTQ